MAKYDPVIQEHVDDPGPADLSPLSPVRGNKTMYTISTSMKLYLATVMIYTLAVFAAGIWVLLGPSVGNGKQLLRIGNAPVDQFYSGLVLSAVLAPAGILIRKISNDLGLLHPFAIASRTPVSMDDLDRMMDTGIVAAKTAFTYSRWHSMVQVILLVVGALLVPIGTLSITTGTYAPNTRQMEVVAVPTGGGDDSGGTFLTFDMQLDSSQPLGPKTNNGTTDTFLGMVLDLFRGTIVSQGGSFSEISEVLGPLSTPNITYRAGVRYHGLVTYTWDTVCTRAEDVEYSVSGDSVYANFTFPDGTMYTYDYYGDVDSDADIVMWIDQNNSGAQIKPTYFALAYDMNFTNSLAADRSAFTVVNGTWVSTVKCLPSFRWEVSSCTWDGTAMRKCIATPNQNTTTLDNKGLDMLNFYMSATPWALNKEAGGALNLPILATGLMYDVSENQSEIPVRAPTLKDFKNLYGLVAHSLAAVSLSGFYGVAEVPTEGQPAQPAYIVRTYILALLFVMFGSVTLLVALDFLYHWWRDLPWRKATFLTIASAVRGEWWDETLQGGAELSHEVLRKRYTAKVAFGVDRENADHVGLGPNVERMVYTGKKRL